MSGTGGDQADLNPALGDEADGATFPYDAAGLQGPPPTLVTPGTDAAPPEPESDAGAEPQPPPDGGVPEPADADAGDPSDPVDADAGGPPDTDAGCALDGRYALRVTFDVDWNGTKFANFVPIISKGSGELSFTLIGDVATAGPGGQAVFRACQASVPDFVSTLPDEHYGVRFANAVWDSPDMPVFPTGFSGCHEVGCALTTPTIHALIGSALPDPSGFWPETPDAGSWPDHDGDGNPGVNADMLGPRPGTSYAYPPLDLIGSRRANALRLGLRVSFGLALQRTTCNAMRGVIHEGAVDTRAADCVATSAPKKCAADELEFVNQNLPVWTVSAGKVEGRRVSSTATCVDARVAFEN